MNDQQGIPSLRTILWACFASLIVTGATSAPAVALASDTRVGIMTGVVAFCATLAVMLGLGGKIPSGTPRVLETTTTTETKVIPGG